MLSNEEKKVLTLNPDELANVYKNVFTTESGKIVLADLKNRCHVRTTTNECPFGMEAGEGMRMAYLHIETQLNHEPEIQSKEVDDV